MGGAVVPPVVPRHPELVAQGIVGHGRILGVCQRSTRRAVAGHVHGAGVRIHCDRGGPLVAPAPVRRRTLLVGPVVPGHPQLNAIGVVRHGGVVIARRGSAIADSAIAAARHVYVAGGGVSRRLGLERRQLGRCTARPIARRLERTLSREAGRQRSSLPRRSRASAANGGVSC